ncbi:hypothetical protein ACTU3I_13840 [Microbacterium sp. RD1]|uniref:hypothetical protein n=1 Tax=Microbacterium sp. RD1 TaxID=3457313 RepID=UPI003FA55CF4
MSTPDEDPDAPTLWAGRLRSPAPEPRVDPAGAPSAEPVDDATAIAARRAPAPPRSDALPEAEADLEVEEGSTRVARRETRRRSTRLPDEETIARLRPGSTEPAVAGAGPGRRTARVPDADAHEIYRPRAAEPAMVERRPPAVREPQHPVAPARSGGARARVVWIVGAVAAMIVVAAAITVLLLAVG